MASSSSSLQAEWKPEDDEPADYGKLDYDYKTVEEKINAGLREKEKGNKLFKEGKYEAAWKQYDCAFVNIYTSKEEWDAIGPGWRKAINEFKLPCHLNRGLCRLRLDDLDAALWDFSEALRIDPSSAKGLYRRGTVRTKITQREIAKEKENELWDLEREEQRVADARKDLISAAKLLPNDENIRNTLEELKQVREALAKHRKKYRKDQRSLYSKLISGLDRENQKLAEMEDREIFADMPPLEYVRIA